MVVYQEGRLKEVVNYTQCELEPDDLTFVKLHIEEWATPVAPAPAPNATSWDPSAVTSGKIDGSGPRAIGEPDDPPGEAPLIEEKPEPLRARLEEDIIELDDEIAAETPPAPERDSGSVNSPHEFLDGLTSHQAALGDLRAALADPFSYEFTPEQHERALWHSYQATFMPHGAKQM